MQLTQTLVAALFAASTAVAAPAASDASMMAAVPEWVIENFVRTCGGGNTWCNYKFNVNTQAGSVTSCYVPVHANNAPNANSGPTNCGPYTVTSSWSGQFGPGNGFTTFAVVDNKQKLIVYPAYTDKQLVSGKVVTPNQKYAPQGLPH